MMGGGSTLINQTISTVISFYEFTTILVDCRHRRLDHFNAPVGCWWIFDHKDLSSSTSFYTWHDAGDDLLFNESQRRLDWMTKRSCADS